MAALNVPRIADVLYEALRRRILLGEEAPGTVLTEVSIADSFEVARPTAKIAIERLAADGFLIRPRRGAGAMVRRFTRDDVVDLYDTRILLESSVHARLADEGVDPSSAADANHLLRAAGFDDSSFEVVAMDVAFHQILVAELTSARLTRLHDQLMREAHFCMAQVQEFHLLTPGQIADEHDLILDAIRQRDPGLAVERTAAHLDKAKAQLLAYIEKSTAAAEPEIEPAEPHTGHPATLGAQL